MIVAEFEKRGDKLLGFTVSGHAEYAKSGEDICCAAVSSAVMMTCNSITDVFRFKAKLLTEENKIKLSLPENADMTACKLVEALLVHLENISEQFEGSIKISI